MLLSDVLATAVERAPGTAAVITEAETVNFAELAARVEARAAQIAAITEPGDRVAVLAENRVEYVELYYAAPLAGRVLVPLNHRLHPEEWRSTLAASGARVLFGERAFLDRIGRAFDTAADGTAGRPAEPLIAGSNSGYFIS